MKSRFADKFIRVMQAFSAKDADALDRELQTADMDPDDDGDTTDARIKDALDWVDAQRAAARDAEAKKKKDEEDCEMEEKKKMKDAADALEAARAQAHGVVGTSDSAVVFKHIVARAELLNPGIAIPTGDAAAAKDAIPALMLKAVKAAYATPAGKAVIEPFLLGSTIDAVTVDNVSGVFTGAAELMRHRNNKDAAPGALSVKDFGKAITPTKLNEINRKFWDAQAKGG